MLFVVLGQKRVPMMSYAPMFDDWNCLRMLKDQEEFELLLMLFDV
jgi:hypothetical protein